LLGRAAEREAVRPAAGALVARAGAAFFAAGDDLVAVVPLDAPAVFDVALPLEDACGLVAAFPDLGLGAVEAGLAVIRAPFGECGGSGWRALSGWREPQS
jgi:hypothetical protein